MTTINQRIRVDFDFPVRFTRGLFAEGNPVFLETVTRLEKEKRHRVLVVIDDGVVACHPGLTGRIAKYFAAHADRLEMIGDPVVVPGGERVKADMTHVMKLVERVNQHGIDRHSCMAIIGGGAVLDMAGFAAAISHRSVRAIRVPTTVLSQDDSGVGVKNGVNLFGKKNFIGTFMPPFAVINDLDFIATLQHRDKIAGVAEAVKVALIRDREFYTFLEANAARLADAELEVLSQVIRRSAEIHLDHIAGSGDPFEFGSARPLDFGHWSAHKMETLTGHRLRHGEAVALGIALDTVYSVKKRFIDPELGERIVTLLETIGFSLWDEQMHTRGEKGELVVLGGLREFREHLGGKLHITLLRGIGEGFEVNEMDEAVVVEAMEWLRARHLHRQATLLGREGSRAAG